MFRYVITHQGRVTLRNSFITCGSKVTCLASRGVSMNSSPFVPNMKNKATEVAKRALKFINSSPTKYHAVEEASKLLLNHDFQQLSETEVWNLKTGGKYFFVRNHSTIVAFTIGGNYKAGEGFNIIGAHTDSPCLKIKPVPESVKSGYLVANVEPYGGGLWHTWFDRDLTVAGSVLVKRGETISFELVHIPKPIMRIPMLAIHLNREIVDGFKIDKQNHLPPVLATLTEQLMKTVNSDVGDLKSSKDPNLCSAKSSGLLVHLLADALKVKANQILDYDLDVCDTQNGVIGGAMDEFLFVGRLDNLAMSFCSLNALVDAFESRSFLETSKSVSMVTLFDNEEVGSVSAQGACSPVVRDVFNRIQNQFKTSEEGAVERSIQKSFLVSADMAHALHPNYPEKHEPNHKPLMHNGLVIKHNSNLRYATNALSATMFREVGYLKGLPCQEFCVNSNMACGSTIGPLLSANLGCLTVDVGAPQLSMHSIREMCGVDDIYFSLQHFKALFEVAYPTKCNLLKLVVYFFAAIDVKILTERIPVNHAGN